MTAQVHQFPCLSDNYGVLVHDSGTGATAAIDAPDADAVLAALTSQGWRLTDILVTHHHGDHTGGIAGLKEHFPEVRVVAPAQEATKIGHVDLGVGEDDIVVVGNLQAKVIATPGHTAGHIVYWFEENDLLFAGDTLFALGCGRVLETPLPVMWDSLVKLMQLPGETQVYCGHEYTLANAKFALSVDGDNELLKERATEIEEMRQNGRATLPTTMALELATNPFLRAEQQDVRRGLGMPDASGADVFSELRERKNRF